MGHREDFEHTSLVHQPSPRSDLSSLVTALFLDQALHLNPSRAVKGEEKSKPRLFWTVVDFSSK